MKFDIKPELKLIPIEQLERCRFQPRSEFNSERLQELANSIIAAGLVQPIVARPLGAKKFEIVAGERRWRAAQLAGLSAVLCLVRNYTDEQVAEAAAIENVNRVDLNPIEEAKAYQRLIDEFGYLHEEIAATIGKSRAKITNSLRLLKLHPQIQEWLGSGRLSEGHGRSLVTVPMPEQLVLAKKAISCSFSVRRLEQVVKTLLSEKMLPKRTSGEADIRILERNLAEQLASPVRIEFDHAKGHGQVKIQFQNLDILEGILGKIKIS